MSTQPSRKQSLPTGGSEGWPEAWEEEREAPGISWTRSGSCRRSQKALDSFSAALRALESNQAVGEVSSLAIRRESSPLEKKKK